MRYARLEKVFKNANLLRKKTVSIIGLGALGSHAASLLVRNGINLKLFDPDVIEETNLSSQNLYTVKDLKKQKVLAAEAYLKEINPDETIAVFPIKITKENVSLVKADVVLDCTDNFPARFILNDFCKKENILFIHAAVIQQKGVIFVVRDVCLRCIYSNVESLDTCENAGITNTIASLIASLQVQQAINLLLNNPVQKDLLRVDLESSAFSFLKVQKNPSCGTCNKKIIPQKSELLIKPCKDRGGWSISSHQSINLNIIRKNFEVIMDTPIVLVIRIDGYEVVVHQHGELIVKADLPLKKLEQIGLQVFA